MNWFTSVRAGTGYEDARVRIGFAHPTLWRMLWRDHIYGATAPRGSNSTIALATLAFASFGSNGCSCAGRKRQTIFGSARSSVFSVLVLAEAGEIVAGTAGRKVTRSPAACLIRRTS